MDLGLSEQQQLLKSTAREFLQAECPTSLVREMEGGDKGYSESLWTKMAGLGWLGLALPEADGGSGGDATDLVVLAEEMGRALAPGPFFSSSVLCGQVLARCAGPFQRDTLLGGICRRRADSGHGRRLPRPRLGDRRRGGRLGRSWTAACVSCPMPGVADCFVVVPTSGSGSRGVPMFVNARSHGIVSAPMKSVPGPPAVRGRV